jgi:hypothetical protein
LNSQLRELLSKREPGKVSVEEGREDIGHVPSVSVRKQYALPRATAVQGPPSETANAGKLLAKESPETVSVEKGREEM